VLRQLLLTALITTICVIQTATVHAIAGPLGKPGIFIPSAGEGRKLDSTAAAMNTVFRSHGQQFSGGHFINAHTVLHFNGGTKTINALLHELSQIEGAVLRIRFSREADIFTSPLVEKERQPRVSDCSIDHNAWADPHAVTITIYLGGDVKLEDLNLPAIRGSGKSEPAE
jgi:hypothetical protein